jgi:hypothetical protein
MTMIATVARGRWWVPAGGFRIATADELRDDPAKRSPPPVPAWALVENAVPGRVGRREWSPFDADEPLFQRLADVDGMNPEQVLAFANQFGFLTGGKPLLTHPLVKLPKKLAKRGVLPQPATGEAGMIHGELPDLWVRHTGGMRRATEVWAMLHSGDRTGLCRLFRWRLYPQGFPSSKLSGEGWVYDTSHDQPAGRLDPPGRVHEWVSVGDSSDCQRMDVTEVATLWLSNQINGHIESLVAPQLALDATGTPVVELWPKTLLAALWLQFATAVASGRDVGRCQACGNAFWSGSGKRRFCSDACKSRAYRERKEAVTAKARKGARKRR